MTTDRSKSQGGLVATPRIPPSVNSSSASVRGTYPFSHGLGLPRNRAAMAGSRRTVVLIPHNEVRIWRLPLFALAVVSGFAALVAGARGRDAGATTLALACCSAFCAACL